MPVMKFKIEEYPVNENEMAIKLMRNSGVIKNIKNYTMGNCRIMVSEDNGHFHLSISHPKRRPTWDEIKYAREQLMPEEETVAMILQGEYESKKIKSMNKNCFHLYGLKKELDKILNA